MRKHSSFTFRSLIICIVLLLANCVFAAAQKGSLVHTFGTQPGDGSYPQGNLIADAAGNLYGATANGGVIGGTIFELSPPTSQGAQWTETILYSFAGGADGATPVGSLVFDASGDVYGTTTNGGIPGCLAGCGTVFELTPPLLPGGNWTLTTIYSFTGGNDGANPFAGLVFDQGGNLYGTTVFGGAFGTCGEPLDSGCGTVFELSPPAAPGGAWTETVLYSFTGGDDGGVPGAPVTFDASGNLFGTTKIGGSGLVCQSATCGTVFELSPSGEGSWTEAVIHNFGSVSGDGTSPETAGLTLTTSGALVGTTPTGGTGGTFGLGTVFGLQPPSGQGRKWAYGVLYSFGTSNGDGLEPMASVIQANGALYGVTAEGGLNSNGAVFQLIRTGRVWTETALLSYGNSGFGGAHPQGGVLLLDGALYGTASQGGKNGTGTAFKIIR